jgi:pimeloyl-ACP methyl ester carboxylesterase
MKELFVKTSLKVISWVLSFSCVIGCATNAPLNVLSYRAQESTQQKNMLIFLRGRGGSHKDFASEGFIDDIKTRALPFDMAVPNAHIGYYFGETLVPRLKADIIDPARRNGYEKIWLVGVSMGGLGALMYSRQFPDDVAGVCLISPFLGYDAIIDEIEEAGGVRQWSPGEYDPQNDWQRMFWHWLKQCAEGEKPMPRIYLGYGTEDPFATAHQLLADILARDHVFTAPGGHTPKTMKQVWRLFLGKGVLR